MKLPTDITSYLQLSCTFPQSRPPRAPITLEYTSKGQWLRIISGVFEYSEQHVFILAVRRRRWHSTGPGRGPSGKDMIFPCTRGSTSWRTWSSPSSSSITSCPGRLRRVGPSVPDIALRLRDRQGFAVARPEFFARLSSGGNSGLTSRECITRN